MAAGPSSPENSATPAGVKVCFDREGDFLEVRFEDVPTTLKAITEDLFEHHTTDGRIVGFAVFNISRYDRQEVTLPLAITVTRS
jgi:hypothetical protein